MKNVVFLAKPESDTPSIFTSLPTRFGPAPLVKVIIFAFCSCFFNFYLLW
jgi:hypothetical protein